MNPPDLEKIILYGLSAWMFGGCLKILVKLIAGIIIDRFVSPRMKKMVFNAVCQPLNLSVGAFKIGNGKRVN